MAPSRGLGLLQARHGFKACQRGSSMPIVACRRATFLAGTSVASTKVPPDSTWSRPLNSSRGREHMQSNIFTVRRCYSSFTEKLADPANKLQSYVSRSHDPFLNLSIEDHILRKSSVNSTILFLYVNRPCIVIGRNQNPWCEVNLAILNAAAAAEPLMQTVPPGIGVVELVRRRSGGGAVFHDEGNLNWSITCPRNDFTRDKHVEMTVRALRRLGVERARVNERHDIVLDQGHEKAPSDPQDTHRTSYTRDNGALPRPLKVSGSAYKLTRQRALHHATTLLNSPNLHIIPRYLRSPAKTLIQAKGIESVSSPVGNIGVDVDIFQQQLQKEFAAMYINLGQPNSIETVGHEYLNIPDIQKGYNELRTEDWMWSQTPQFDLLLNSSDDIGIHMNVRHGIIRDLVFNGPRFSTESQKELGSMLIGQKLQDIGDWSLFLRQHLKSWDAQSATMAKRLDELIPIPRLLKP